MSTITRRQQNSIKKAAHRFKRGLIGVTSVLAAAALVVTGLAVGGATATAAATGATAGLDFGTYNGPRMVQLSEGGDQHVLGLDADGKLWGWGVNTSRQVTGVAGPDVLAPVELTAVMNLLAPGESIVQLAGAHVSSFALTSTGRVISWGDDSAFALGRNTSAAAPGFVLKNATTQLTGITQISAGVAHVLAIDETGHVWSWGLNASGQTGYALKNQQAQRFAFQVSGISNVTDVSAGRYHSLAISNGKAMAWGYNEGYLGVAGKGQFNNRTFNPAPVLTTTGMTGTIVDVYAGMREVGGVTLSYAVDDSGQVWSWGGYTNVKGQLGRGGAVHLPGRVLDTNDAPLTGITAVVAGLASAYALASDGTAYSWGWGVYGQGGRGPATDVNRATKIKNFDLGGDMTDIESISAGWYHVGIISSVGDDDGVVSIAGHYNRTGLVTPTGANDTRNNLVPNLVWKFEQEYKEFPQELVPVSGETALNGVAQPVRTSGDFNYGVAPFALTQETANNQFAVDFQLSGPCVRNTTTTVVSLSSAGSACTVKRSFDGTALSKPLPTETWTVQSGLMVQDIALFTDAAGGFFHALTADSSRVTLPTLTDAPVNLGNIKYTVDASSAAVCSLSSHNGTATNTQRYLQVLGDGECIITAEQVGNVHYYEPLSKSATFTIGVGKAPQALAMTSLDGIRYAASEPEFTLPPTTDAPASQPASYTVAPASAAVCSIVGTAPNQSIKALSAGNCVLGVTAPGADATPGNNGFLPFADTKTIVIGKGVQTLSMVGIYDGLTAVTTQSAMLPTATIESVALSNWMAAKAPAETKVNVCSVVGGVVEAGVDAPAAGSTDYVLCQVTVSNAGNANYEPFSYSEIVEISERKQQSLDLSVLNGRKFGDAPFTLPTTTTVGGQPVSYTASGSCTVAESGGVTTVTITAGGPCLISANAEGTVVPDANGDIWRPYGTETVAPVAAIGQHVANMPALNGLKVGSVSGLLPTVTVQGLPVTNWASAAPSVCIVADGRVQILLDGDCTITASNAGNASYAPFEYELTFAAAINYDGLNAAIAAKVTGTNADGKYTAGSWATYQAALAAAEARQDPNGGTQADVDAATAELTAAKNGLVFRADFTLLQQEVTLDAALVEGDFTAGSWDAYEVALAAANTVLGDLNATQAEVDAALAELQAKVALLVDISALNGAVQLANTADYIESDYSAASWADYVAALADAETVLNDPNATQAEVDAALLALEDAIAGLAYAEQTLLGLQAAITGHAVGDAPVTLPATTDRGATVTYTAGPADICEIVDGKLVINGFGTCLVEWSAPAIGNFPATTGSAEAPTGPGLQLLSGGVQLAADARVGAGETLTARGGGLYPGTEAQVKLLGTDRILGTGTVAADGTVTITFEVPGDVRPGSYTIHASGVSGVDESTLTRTASVNIVNLAFTGVEIAPFAAGALLLLLGGAGFLLVARNRRRLAGVTD